MAKTQKNRGYKQKVRKSKKSNKSKKSKKSNKKGKNPFMKALGIARSNEAEEFTYKGKTYVKDYAKTGMIIYKSK